MKLLQQITKVDNPLCNAKWIWPIEFDTPRNTYVQCRYDCYLKQVPHRAPFFITADQFYMLYVNGKYVCRGPARGYQEVWPYDEVDLAGYLQKGHNWIIARVYNGGISTFQYLHKSAADFLCAAEWGKTRIYSGQDWLVRFEPGYHRDTARYSWQLNYQEWVDAKQNDQSWITSSALPKGNGWAKPAFCRPFGVMPWHSLEQRGIPNLTNHLVVYERAAYATSGICMRNWRHEANLFKPVFQEFNKNRKWTIASAPQIAKDGLIVKLPAAHAGKYVCVSVDMGRPCIGSLVIESQAPLGGTMDFFFTEGLFEDGHPIVGPEFTSGCAAAMVNRIELKTGKTSHEFFQMIGHRYVVTIARETLGPVTLKLALR